MIQKNVYVCVDVKYNIVADTLDIGTTYEWDEVFTYDDDQTSGGSDIDAIIDGSITKLLSETVTKVRNSCFKNCSTLTSVDLPEVTSIRMYCFENCTQLLALILRNTDTVCDLVYKNVFDNTPIASGTGYIYVPKALVESYKTATNWVTYANQFRALEDYTVDGTVTGALDTSKI